MTSARPKVDRIKSSLSRVQMGIAQADITPPVGISANPWGKSTTALSTGIHRPLVAVAACIRATRDLFIVTLDLGWIGCYECDVVNFRGRVARELEISIDDLLVNLSQTHKGPPFCIHEALREGRELVPDWIEIVITSVINICRLARESVELTDITWQYGKCDLGTVRELSIDGIEYVGYNPGLSPDDVLVVGRATIESGRTVATFVNYGCHPTSVGWESSLVSPDYVGRAREIIENETGAPMIFLLGACGNVAPRLQYSGDVTIADRNGEMLGYAVMATIANMMPPASDLAFEQTIISGALLARWIPQAIVPNSCVNTTKIFAVLKHKKLHTREEMESAWAPVTASAEFLDFRIFKQFEMRKDYVREGGVVHHPIWIWQLGDAIFIAHCGEAYLEMARELRFRNPERMILWLDMTNGPGYMYVPTAAAYDRDSYQSQQSLLARGSFEEMLEILDQSIKNRRV
ncbi:MAG: hypothetical protein H7227_07575 [Actinobacteria bacterium]|nr:hypothetical protein [Actinomycetota bacterium]